jgi:uncharacterized protein with FMN-binding domain
MRRVVFAAVSTIVGLIMLLSFKTHAIPSTLATPAAAIGQPVTTTAPATAPTSTTGSAAATAGSNTASTTSATVTVTGSAVQTRYGPVAVQITVTAGKVTSAEAVTYPTQSSRDRQINARAVPQLNAEAVAAQTARIHMVSGATYTSTGYINSLQSALDKAGLG